MKKSLAAVALGAALIGGVAQAADLPSRKAPAPVYAPPPVMTWTGFYGGLNLGGGWANGANRNAAPYYDPNFPIGAPLAPFPNLVFLPSGANGGASAGVVGGGQLGYNYQFGTSFLVGLETDFQGTSISGPNQGNNVAAYPSPFAGGSLLLPLGIGAGGNVGVPWFGTVRGRVGWLATPTLLVYGTGGFAYGDVTGFNRSSTRTGWTAGGGAEWMFMPHWSAKVEYLYTDLSSSGDSSWAYNNWGWSGGRHRETDVNTVRAGVNYHFNWAAPAPVAKY